LRVSIDGIPYVMGNQEFYDTTPGYITLGENRASGYIEPKFTGQIDGIRRGPLAPAVAAFSGGGFVRLGWVLPQGRGAGGGPQVDGGRPREQRHPVSRIRGRHPREAGIPPRR